MDRRSFLKRIGLGSGAYTIASVMPAQAAECGCVTQSFAVNGYDIWASRDPDYLKKKIKEFIAAAYWDAKKRGIQPWIIFVSVSDHHWEDKQYIVVHLDSSDRAKEHFKTGFHFEEDLSWAGANLPPDVLEDWRMNVTKMLMDCGRWEHPGRTE